MTAGSPASPFSLPRRPPLAADGAVGSLDIAENGRGGRNGVSKTQGFGGGETPLRDFCELWTEATKAAEGCGGALPRAAAMPLLGSAHCATAKCCPAHCVACGWSRHLLFTTCCMHERVEGNRRVAGVEQHLQELPGRHRGTAPLRLFDPADHASQKRYSSSLKRNRCLRGLCRAGQARQTDHIQSTIKRTVTAQNATQGSWVLPEAVAFTGHRRRRRRHAAETRAAPAWAVRRLTSGVRAAGPPLAPRQCWGGGR